MQVPLAMATWMASTGACCTTGECPIHGHHHPSQNSDNAPLDCGHGGHDMSKMDSCTMSCCQNTEQTAVHANLFLLTPLSVSTSVAPHSAISFSSATTKISPVFAPLAPPPKSFLS